MMTKVFIVVRSFYEGDSIMAVFSTKEKAEKFITGFINELFIDPNDTYEGEFEGHRKDYEIRESVLDEIPITDF
jgi:hypothetical protein